MPLTKLSLNKILGLKVCQAGSVCGIENFDIVNSFGEHDSVEQPMGEVVSAVDANWRAIGLDIPGQHGFLLLSNDGMDPVVAHAVQSFHIFN